MSLALVGLLLPVPGAVVLKRLEAPPVLTSPVFSLATLDASGATNMNLLTYVSPVGIRPDRLWTISLFRKTASAENFVARRTGVLQQLTHAHAPLTYALGGTRFRAFDGYVYLGRLEPVGTVGACTCHSRA